MPRFTHVILIVALQASATGCASTSMTSMPAPEIANRPINTIMVLANFSDLGLRRDAEARFVAAGSAPHTRFLASSALFFPGQQYTPTQVAAIEQANGIEATLLLSAAQAGSTSGNLTSTCGPSYIPGESLQCSTSTNSRLWARFTAQLFDVRTGKTIWLATANTQTGMITSTALLVNSVVDKTLKQLASDHVTH